MSAPERSVYARALTRVQQEFARTTDSLIQALFLQSREPSTAISGRIAELEKKRDELHLRLEELEMRETAARPVTEPGVEPALTPSSDTAPSADDPPGGRSGGAR